MIHRRRKRPAATKQNCMVQTGILSERGPHRCGRKGNVMSQCVTAQACAFPRQPLLALFSVPTIPSPRGTIFFPAAYHSPRLCLSGRPSATTPSVCTDRGYAERSRRSRVWDPESPVYAKEDSKGHHSANPRPRDAASPRPYNVGWNEGKERSGTLTTTSPGEGYSTRDRNHKTRNRRKRLAADADHPLEMDWKEVTRNFRGFSGWLGENNHQINCFGNISS